MSVRTHISVTAARNFLFTFHKTQYLPLDHRRHIFQPIGWASVNFDISLLINKAMWSSADAGMCTCTFVIFFNRTEAGHIFVELYNIVVVNMVLSKYLFIYINVDWKAQQKSAKKNRGILTHNVTEQKKRKISPNIFLRYCTSTFIHFATKRPPQSSLFNRWSHQSHTCKD